jgi:hypothetical protein
MRLLTQMQYDQAANLIQQSIVTLLNRGNVRQVSHRASKEIRNGDAAREAQYAAVTMTLSVKGL